jgi:hypothetical protein
MARIWSGIHFRDAMDNGYYLAHQTARRVADKLDGVLGGDARPSRARSSSARSSWCARSGV